MPTNIVIPEMGESVTQGVIAAWRKKPGEFVKRDETVLELETDKITAEIPAPASGVLTPTAREGDTVKVGAVVGQIDESAAASASAPAAPAAPAKAASAAGGANGHAAGAGDVRATPLARKLAEEHGVDIGAIAGTGAGGRVREQDVLDAVATRGKAATAVAPSPAAAQPALAPAATVAAGARREKMSQLRQRIAARLVEAQHTAAMLTTFNECDMSAVMDLRKQYKESFEKKHGIGLGFMSFFVKAVGERGPRFPLVNASIVQNASTGELRSSITTAHVAVAVGTLKGLVVPVLRNCEACRLRRSSRASGPGHQGPR